MLAVSGALRKAASLRRERRATRSAGPILLFGACIQANDNQDDYPTFHLSIACYFS
jgi:hypothetical protein